MAKLMQARSGRNHVKCPEKFQHEKMDVIVKTLFEMLR